MDKQQNNMHMHEATLMSVLNQLLVHSNLSANALAKKLNLPTPTIYRILTGEVRDPRSSTLIAIADYFGVKVDQLLGKESLKEFLHLHEPASLLIARPPMSIPILTISEIVEYEKSSVTPTEWFRWQNQITDHDSNNHKNIFAVVIKNNVYAPVFVSGTYIIVNPNIQPDNGDYVLVNFAGETSSVIKMFISDGRFKYLYPLKSELKNIQFNDNECKIIGVIIEAYTRFKN